MARPPLPFSNKRRRTIPFFLKILEAIYYIVSKVFVLYKIFLKSGVPENSPKFQNRKRFQGGNSADKKAIADDLRQNAIEDENRRRRQIEAFQAIEDRQKNASAEIRLKQMESVVAIQKQQDEARNVGAHEKFSRSRFSTLSCFSV